MALLVAIVLAASVVSVTIAGHASSPLSGIAAAMNLARITSTSVSCDPATLPLNAPTTCTATVSDIDAGTTSLPTGTVSFSADGGAAFATCGLTGAGNTASCGVSFVPDAVGPRTIAASYAGSAEHLASSSLTAISATMRSTATSVGCDPISVPVNATATCTAIVTDTSPGTAITPTGTVIWDSSNWGRFGPASGTFSGPPPSCALAGSGNAASCAVSYTPTAAGLYAISAAYSGDATHSGSSGKTVAGGGQVQGSSGKASFGFIAQQQTSGGTTVMSGQIDYFNHDSGLNVRGNVTGLAIAGNTASFSGACSFRTPSVQWSDCDFSVDVTDNGEPGGFSDAFNISVTNSVAETNGGTIQRGNIQVGARP